jgi:hypothetical protein
MTSALVEWSIKNDKYMTTEETKNKAERTMEKDKQEIIRTKWIQGHGTILWEV